MTHELCKYDEEKNRYKEDYKIWYVIITDEFGSNMLLILGVIKKLNNNLKFYNLIQLIEENLVTSICNFFCRF